VSDTVVAGFVISLVVALIAFRMKALTISGVVVAIIIGTISVAAGWDWVVVLLAFFIVTSALSAIGSADKRLRTESVVEKFGGRDGWQVLANGGAFATAAAMFVNSDELSWKIAGFGALAAATSDSWATEIGTLSRKSPWSITNGRHVPPGTSGGITVPGTLAAIGGAAFISLVSLLADWVPGLSACVLIGGVSGSTADSLLGGTLQMQRRCLECGAFTERRTHNCGGTTRVVRGIPGFDNDGVNAVATVIGGLVAYLFSLYVLR
jgi:uncharacterized protein (TIGR00297 family)